MKTGILSVSSVQRCYNCFLLPLDEQIGVSRTLRSLGIFLCVCFSALDFIDMYEKQTAEQKKSTKL